MTKLGRKHFYRITPNRDDAFSTEVGELLYFSLLKGLPAIEPSLHLNVIQKWNFDPCFVDYNKYQSIISLFK